MPDRGRLTSEALDEDSGSRLTGVEEGEEAEASDSVRAS
jgi:hypothetical protein